MNNRDQYKGILRFWASAILMMLQTGIYTYAWFNWYADAGLDYFFRGNYVVIGLYALISFFFMKAFGCFQIGKIKTGEIIFTQILSTLCVNAVTHLQLCLIGVWRLTENLAPILYMTAADIVLVILWAIFVTWVFAKLYPPRAILMIYGEREAVNLLRKMKIREDKYDVRESVSCNVDWDILTAKIDQYGAVLMADISSDIRNKILKYCFNNHIRCYAVPKISDIMIMSAEKIQISDTALLLFRNQGLSAGQRCIKRIFDIVVGVIAVIIASPVMLVIGIAIKVYDGGPVFFIQDRLTRNGEVFRIYKFRSMRVQGADEKKSITKKNDDRITPVGHVIRKLHLDELPQVFNIIKGDMSFVGPRPEWTATTDLYSQHLPEFLFRLKVKAGLTGYAQVYGKYNTTPYDKLMLDLTYIEKYSFWLDIKLMLLTVKTLFQKENTEGVEAWQTSAQIEDEHGD